MIRLSARLASAAAMVREGASLADVGCDHGYLPVWLLLNGKIKNAIACDINEGPLFACRSLVCEYSLENKVRCVLSDGLNKIYPDDCTDITICGMGGELIAEIMAECTWAKNVDKHYIFNPMTHPEILRKYLCKSGFSLGRDLVVKEGKHYYSVFEAFYDGSTVSYPESYYFLGNINDFTHKEYFLHIVNHLNNKMKGGADYSQVIAAIKEKL